MNKKILFVSMNNIHFKKWVEQLYGAGFDLYWFDVLDQGNIELEQVTKITGWKKGFLKKRGRTFLKKNFPKLFQIASDRFDVPVTVAFENTIKAIQPDLIQCFEMNISGIKLLPVLEKYNIPLLYNSWGSDLFHYEQLGMQKLAVQAFLKRCQYLITDCKRDYTLATQLGFKNNYLGQFPGNGGVEIPKGFIEPVANRNLILIKGYEDGIGKALTIVEALEKIPLELFEPLELIIYSADVSVVEAVKKMPFFRNIQILVHTRYEPIPNMELLKLMGKAQLHIANSLSDGMPNAMLEAMAMGAFPIQSNPGGVTQEVIENGSNGFLINDPLNSDALALQIKEALDNQDLRAGAQEINLERMSTHISRSMLQSQIVHLYRQIMP